MIKFFKCGKNLQLKILCVVKVCSMCGSIVLYRPIPAYTGLYRPTSSYTGLHRPTSSYIGLYRPIPPYINPLSSHVFFTLKKFLIFDCAWTIAQYKTFHELKIAVKHCNVSLKKADFLHTFPIHFLLVFDLKRAFVFAQYKTFHQLKFAVKHDKFQFKICRLSLQLIFLKC